MRFEYGSGVGRKQGKVSMTEVTDFEREFTILLDKAVQQATFFVPTPVRSPEVGFPYTGNQLRQNFYSNSGYARMQLAGAQVQLEEVLLGELAAALHAHLGDYILDNRIGNGLALILGGRPQLSIPDYARHLVRAAALLGTEPVAHLLFEWAKGEPVHYHTCVVLSGISVDELKSMEGGIHFSSLPASSDALANELPLGVDFHLGIMNMAGATKVTIECQDYPVLFRPGEFPDIQTVTYGSSRQFLYAELCEALGLACNNHVSWAITWPDYGDLAIFGSGGGGGFAFGPDARFNSGDPPISQEQLDLAGHLLTKRRENPSPTLEIPIHRWMSSKRPSASLADRFVDLRIALESLYLGESGPELSFRLATHGAWHLGGNFEERQVYYKTLRDAYATASTAVHRGAVNSTETNHKLLTDAQNLCRSAILKRLEEGKEPDWNELILGKGLDTAVLDDNGQHP